MEEKEAAQDEEQDEVSTDSEEVTEQEMCIRDRCMGMRSCSENCFMRKLLEGGIDVYKRQI